MQHTNQISTPPVGTLQISTPRSRTYLNGVLTAIALLLAVIALKPAELTSVAMAQPAVKSAAEPVETGLMNASEQRKTIIAELRTMNKHFEKLEATLAKGVRVSEMPEMKLPAEFRDALKASKAGTSEKIAKPAN